MNEQSKDLKMIFTKSGSSSSNNLFDEKEKENKVITSDYLSNSSHSSKELQEVDKDKEKEKEIEKQKEKERELQMQNYLEQEKNVENELPELIEYDDHIEYKGAKLYKPFVEKPCNGDDHAIHIYYPPSLGGGQKRLFRKTLNICSLYIPDENSIRRDKSYIYEEFLQNDGFDIKVYTVGPEYAHAEARKSPTLDGIVRV
jgi:hypothetical protein